MNADDLEKAMRRAFATARPEIVAVYLYGSRARGTATARSDVDLALLYNPPPAATLEGQPFDIEAELERGLGVPVEIIVLNHAPVDLVHRVLRDGILVLDRDRSFRIHIEAKARNEFFGLQPHLTRYRAARPPAS
jgi:uncharacterized protein